MRPELYACLSLAAIFGPLLLVLGLAPRRTLLVGQEVRIVTALKVFRFDLREVLKAQDVDAQFLFWPNALRVCGVGWPFRAYGWFWHKDHGVVLAMTTDAENLLLLHRRGRRLLVSPQSQRAVMLKLQDLHG